MNPQTLLRTACKIFGLYLFVLAALNVRDLLFYMLSMGVRSPVDSDEILIILLPFYMLVFNTIAGLLLISNADWIAGKLRAPANGYINSSLEKTDVIEVVLIAIGVIAIVYAVPEMFYKLVTYAYFNDYDKNEKRLFWSDGNNLGALLFSAFKFAAGLFLLLNARNFAWRLRRTGDRNQE